MPKRGDCRICDMPAGLRAQIESRLTANDSIASILAWVETQGEHIVGSTVRLHRDAHMGTDARAVQASYDAAMAGSDAALDSLLEKLQDTSVADAARADALGQVALETIIQRGIIAIRSGRAVVTPTNTLSALTVYLQRYGTRSAANINDIRELLGIKST